MSDLFSSSTPIDLSRLPVPVFIDQPSFETIKARKLAQLMARCAAAGIAFDATVESDPAMKLVEVAAYDELLLRQEVQDACAANLLAFATGPILDHLGALEDVQRLTVTPADPATGADAVLESDDDFRKRIVLAPESFSVAGPELAYVFFAKSASGGVADASAISPNPGEVLVSVLSADGDGTASAELVAAVSAVVTSKPVRPLTDAVTVQSAQIVPYEVDATLYTYAGPDSSIVLAAALAGIAAYQAESRSLGRSVTLSGLNASMKVEGVQRVVLHSPAEDVNCDPTQAANCTGSSVALGGNAN